MKKTRTHKSIIKNLWTYALAFLLMLSNFTGLIQADGPDPQVDPSTPVVEEKQDPAEESPKDENTKPQEEGENSENTSENAEEEKTIEEDTNEEENDGLEISDPDVKPAVTKTPDKPNKPKKPSINPVSINDKKISGGDLVGAGQRKTFNLVCKIHVTIKDAENNVKETKVFSIQPSDKSRTWNVNLYNPVKAGYTVTAKQEFGENNFSDETSVEVKQLLAPQYEDKLSMPTLEVWSEDLSVLEADAVEDILNAFKKHNKNVEMVDNKTLEQNASSIIVAGNGKSINIVFTDSSTLTVDASNVTVNQITEVSTAPIINTLKVTDGIISGRVDLTKVDAPERLKVEIVTDFGQTEPKDFCTDNGCSIDKGTKVFATVNPETGEFSYEIGNNNVKLGTDFGVIVKEYRKKIIAVQLLLS